MILRTLLMTAAAAGLVASPLAAQATPVRAPAPVEGDSEQLVGLLWQYLILPVVIAVVLAALSGDDDEEPASP